MRTRRLVLGAFLIYLFGLLGFQGASHSHESGQSPSQSDPQSDPQPDPQSHPQSHHECQLCHVTAQAYLAPEPVVCPEIPAVPVLVVEAVRESILSQRHQPFSSRAPPSV